MLAHDACHVSVVDMFHNLIGSSLQHHRPPLRALDAAADVDPEIMLGVGALVIDIGTGEMKLMAALHFELVEMHEMCSVKWPKFVRSGAATADADGQTRAKPEKELAAAEIFGSDESELYVTEWQPFPFPPCSLPYLWVR